MIFNSFAFAIFFPTVLLLYWLLPRRGQNILLLAASYFFYGWWDWRFLGLLLISTCADYLLAWKIHHESQHLQEGERRGKRWVAISVIINLTFLGFFKYFNFFVESLETGLGALGVQTAMLHLSVVLPVGISFYTFQSMSYIIDVYRREVKPASSFPDYALFVAFFPQLVAGPISRATMMLPQVLGVRHFSREQFRDGLYLIFWGLFKKVYVADNLAPVVDRLFALSNPSGFEVVCAAYAFAFQIYCDFSGYTDIARGAAKCMGFELPINFNLPYLSQNPKEFWTRWHISLSSWLRDYLYIPLGGNRYGAAATYRNLGLTMLLGGIWHGAAWKFLLWGAYQGALLVVHRLLEAAGLGKRQGKEPAPARLWAHVERPLKILFFFQLICVGWLIFRANSLAQIGDMLRAVATWRGTADLALLNPLMQFVAPLLILEVVQFGLLREDLGRTRLVPVWGKAAMCSVIFYLLAFHGASSQSFIYFQF